MSQDEKEPIILFGPRTGKSLLRLYPELNKDEEFKALSSDDLLFAWYVGIPGSPITLDHENSVRYRMAAARCFQKDEEKRQRYGVNMDPPDEVKIAIKKFEAMSPDARLMAKQMTQKTFENFQKLLDVDVEKDFLVTKTVGRGEDKEEITEMNWTGRKSYVDSAKTIIEALPELIKKIEEGYGVTEKMKTEEGPGNKSIDKYHSQKLNR